MRNYALSALAGIPSAAAVAVREADAAARAYGDGAEALNTFFQLVKIAQREPARADLHDLVLRYAASGETVLLRLQAFQLLGHMTPTERSVGALVAAVGAAEIEDELRIAAASSLLKVRPDSSETRDAILGGLRRLRGAQLELWMAERVARRWPRDVEAISLCADALSRTAPDRRVWSLRSWFGELPAAERVEMLVGLMRHPHLRLEGAVVLGELGAEGAPALPVLREMLGACEDEDERYVIERAIRRIEGGGGGDGVSESGP